MNIDPTGATWLTNYLKITPMGLAARLIYGPKAVDKALDHFTGYLSRNEQTIASVLLMIVGVATVFIPGVNAVGAIAIGAGLGALRAGVSTNFNGHFNDYVTGALVGAASSLIGAGAGQVFANAFTGLGVQAGMALQRAASGALGGGASTATLLPRQPLSIAHLPKGRYAYRLVTKNRVWTGKVVIGE